MGKNEISQGAKANQNGKIFEEMTIILFERNGFKVMSFTEWKKAGMPVNKVVVKQTPYTTIYNHKGKTEFVIFDGDRAIRVEDKWQQSAGSVDEKFPYMYLNGVFSYPEKEIIFVIDGDGFKKGGVEWIKNKVKENWLNYKEQGKTIYVFTQSEFVKWFNSNF